MPPKVSNKTVHEAVNISVYPKGLVWVTPICLHDADVIQRIYRKNNAPFSDDENLSPTDEDAAQHITSQSCGTGDHSTQNTGADENNLTQSEDCQTNGETSLSERKRGPLPKAVMDQPKLSVDYLIERFNHFEDSPKYQQTLKIEDKKEVNEKNLEVNVRAAKAKGYDVGDEEEKILATQG
ncbi:hypothetical protein D9619_003839 [Psilocybe cf. subviscida]|uniref:Uncharacterized protein n=1 Tax=Psilocybe cf. subviscida TaxID=2480587 RepID=A0A8H5AXA2_9AGAR|nr:hypothetical protein D9619_003839 [Psilocybe cf. subviscida]